MKDGRLAGALSTNDVVAMIADYMRPQVLTDEYGVTVRSHALAVYSPGGPVDEVEITATGSRDYEIYFPDTAEMRASLPLSFDADFAGAVKVGSWWTNKVHSLPALMRVREPVPGTCILSVEVFGE